jgi:hypothetical protein
MWITHYHPWGHPSYIQTMRANLGIQSPLRFIHKLNYNPYKYRVREKQSYRPRSIYILGQLIGEGVYFSIVRRLDG